jgi:glucose-1-phosphate thymidylyltransferase
MNQAVILAAGEGRRLKPFTVNKPKAMIYIAGKPIIQYVLESLASNGIREIVLIVGYKREQILDYIGDGHQFGVTVRYINQTEQLGTAHALMLAREVIEGGFLVLSGDKLITPDTIAGIVKSHAFSILLKREESAILYDIIEVKNGLITRIAAPSTESKSNLINTGIYVFNQEIFNYIGTKLDIPDVLKEVLSKNIKINAVETAQPWLNVVYPWDILNLNATILYNVLSKRSGTIESNVILKDQVSIGQGTIIRSNSYITGPVVIGDGCEIGPNVYISGSTSIGDNVVVSPFTQIKNSVVGDDVHIGTSCSIEDSIIDRGCVIGGHFCAYSEVTEMRVDRQLYTVKIGALIGEGCEINNGVVAQPGLIAGNYCRVKSLKTVSGTLADKSLIL